MLFATLVIATAILGPVGPSNAYKSNSTIYQLVMPIETCPKDMEWKHCKDTGKPSCYKLRITFRKLYCEPGCQCKNGLFLSRGKCVSDCSKEECYGPNEVRSKCDVDRECQPTCFSRKDLGFYSRSCAGPCIPFVCACEKGYIRLHYYYRKDRCVSLATCKKLKDQYGSSLPPEFNVSNLLDE
ncbi:unnamed protein product [Cylicocyclus nassatus]|uniref:TIL domain-containing protein n=1 Tax=Cylicocyclus nassatus TaxID=53992 RepID=A0AA36DLB9_CYLNA|nr:unnamed protein product [Cylicocyclus nassatus]